jgi:hypothetical protein
MKLNPARQILVSLAREVHLYLEDDRDRGTPSDPRFNLCDWSEGGGGRILRHASYDVTHACLIACLQSMKISGVAPSCASGGGSPRPKEGHA